MGVDHCANTRVSLVGPFVQVDFPSDHADTVDFFFTDRIDDQDLGSMQVTVEGLGHEGGGN